MHLRSLTLKGFKSFAQATTFAFEPGVTCIVGPNGSGKSNVVDGLAWVMGEQGAKNLRGGSMADVIFAGTATRGPLGRAEVVLTIDNADGALPIEYAEVAISRTLFRDGRSEYAINGDGCRLLDVQELLSDSGLGREMHVIVGQGQLDAVLRASPEERRGFVEEAAGILKHRRRKERTLRKLESMQANLTRLTDLADELRRQLKPLGAQAEIAREAATIQAEVREARTRLLAFDASRLRASIAAMEAEHAAVAVELEAAQDADRTLGRRAAQLEAVSDDADLDRARRTALDLEHVQERLRSLAQIAATRVALLAPDEAAVPVGAAGTAAERQAVAAGIDDAVARLDAARAAEAAAREAQGAAQRRLDAIDARIAADATAVADHDRALTAVRGRFAVAESRLAAAQAEAARRTAALAAARQRAADAAEALPQTDADTEDGQDLGELEAASLTTASAVDAARGETHELERLLAAADARVAALTAATATPASAADVLQALPGSRRLQDTLDVDPRWAAAVGAVLGPLLDAAVLPLPDAEAAAAAVARVAELGGVDLVAEESAAVPYAAGGVRAVDVVRGPSGVLALLADVVLVDDLDAAIEIAASGVTAATRGGEVVVGPRIRAAGSAASGVELAADRDAAVAEAAGLRQRLGEATELFAAARDAARAAREMLATATARERERQQARQAAERRRAALVARSDAAVAEVRRLETQEAEADLALRSAQAARAAAAEQAAEAESAPRPEIDAAERPDALALLDAEREAALAARLDTQTLIERLRADRDRLAALERQAQDAEAAATAAARRAAERTVQRQAAEAVLAELPPWQASVDASVTEARDRLGALERERAERNVELRSARERLAAARATVAELDSRSRDLEMHAYEQRVSFGAVLERALAEVGLTEQPLLAEATEGLDRAAEERRLSAAERRLARLGRVNPLALEEFAALEQRQVFLAEQLADLHRTRADLLKIVDDLDTRIATIFASAYEDTERAFTRIFPVLFPGGSGRLSLTESDAPDGAGIEVSVRPVGKKIERLSLLSGGERSLAAIAFLLAIFTARPSPFYILDEVEAALDDANLGRLLEVISSLRERSQLILITHQKRTMEIADALYGVSMRQDGVSNVIGQRMAQRA